MKTPLALRVDPGLLERVDEARGDVPRTRWIERAMEAALGNGPALMTRTDADARGADRQARRLDDAPTTPREAAEVDPVVAALGRRSAGNRVRG